MEIIIAAFLLCAGLSLLLISKNQKVLWKTVNIEGVVDVERKIRIIKISGHLLLLGSGLFFIFSLAAL